MKIEMDSETSAVLGVACASIVVIALIVTVGVVNYKTSVAAFNAGLEEVNNFSPGTHYARPHAR